MWVCLFHSGDLPYEAHPLRHLILAGATEGHFLKGQILLSANNKIENNRKEKRKRNETGVKQTSRFLLNVKVPKWWVFKSP